ncbi:PspA/IM30 family protein [Lawsonella clevelandensis]|uniref:PspA/IM30 family protein n=1 Tax=Lawsonella clevelandensis TaxID=1528099 RepID=UPI00290FCD0E|nr:PspA/IM30 family protein [Lawsonella clevelandensis]MDU7193869.1 PspA/IM30 family protein [Lawsonella clevelandensis]
MANPFVKAWKYLMAKLDLTVEENADPKVQIEQAIAEAKRQHQELSQQAAAVVGNQRQLEMKMNRQLADVEKIKNNVRQALLMAEDARKKGDNDKAAEYENAANAFSAQLVTAETAVTDLKSLYSQSSGASDAARAAVERNARVLQQQLAERTKLLNQLDQAKMQEKVVQTMQQLNAFEADNVVPNLEQVREKIESRYAQAMGQTELANGGMANRLMEIEANSSEMITNNRLEEIRVQMVAAGELPGGEAPAPEQLTAAPGETAAPVEAVDATVEAETLPAEPIDNQPAQ